MTNLKMIIFFVNDASSIINDVESTNYKILIAAFNLLNYGIQWN